MDMSTVVSTGFQQVNPQAVEPRLAREVKRRCSGKLRGVTPEKLREIGDGGVAALQIVEGCVAGVPGIAMLPRPSTARFVIHRKRANRMREIAQQGRITELGFIELRDEE